MSRNKIGGWTRTWIVISLSWVAIAVGLPREEWLPWSPAP